MWSLNEMEVTGGEPDVVGYDEEKDEYTFYDCSKESPKGRRSLCYDLEALESRKKHKPENNVIDVANAMGIELLTEEQYREMQQLGDFDMKISQVGYKHLQILENSVVLYFAIIALDMFSCTTMEQTLTMLPEVFVAR